MDDIFEQIMNALLSSLSGMSAVEIGRNIDIPVQLETGLLISVNDGQELARETVLGVGQYTQHQHQAEIVVVSAASDPDDRDSSFDVACRSIRDAVLVDPTFGGLIGGLELRKPDGVTDGSEGSGGIKAGAIPVTFYYDTNSFF